MKIIRNVYPIWKNGGIGLPEDDFNNLCMEMKPYLRNDPDPYGNLTWCVPDKVWTLLLLKYSHCIKRVEYHGDKRYTN